MKKFICVLVVCVLIAACCVALAACKADKMKDAVKNGDHYTIAASYDNEAHILSAVQTVKVTNRSDNSFDSVKFHIYANQYRQDANNPIVPNAYRTKAYPNGDSWGDISFDNVKANGKSVAFVIEGEDCDILSVPIEGGLFPDKCVTIEMTYQVQLANAHHRLGYNENTINLGNWYPVLCHIDNGCYTTSPYYNVGDPFVSEIANYNVSITLPQNFVVASTGELQDATNNGENVTYTYKADAVRDFAMVLSDKFTKISKTVDGVTVNYYYYNDVEPENSLATACGMLQYLNKNVGKYPYAQYSVTETEFCYGGMEYPNLALITSKSASYQEAIAHETAHQWFYGIVGNDQINNAWMDEGLSEYLTYMYLDSTNEMPLSRSMLACTKTYVTYVDVLTRFYEDVDRSMRPVNAYKNDNEYVVFTYVKGSLLFNTLYETVGANKFWKSLQTYFDQAQFDIAPSSQMIECFASVCGDEAGTIFTNFIQGKEVIGKVTD